jgi:hypothetical protein
MPGESFFMAFGGVGLSLAGFAGLIATMRRGPANDAVAAYRSRTIVFLGFSLTFVGFGTVAAYAITGDVTSSIRLGCVVMAISFLRGLLVDTRPGPVWPTEGPRRGSIAVLLVMLAVTLGNVAIASVPYLQGLMILGLIGPVSIFYATIVDATGGAAATAVTPTSTERESP